MALATIGNIASKLLPSIIGWGTSKLSHQPIGQKVVRVLGDMAVKKVNQMAGKD